MQSASHWARPVQARGYYCHPPVTYDLLRHYATTLLRSYATTLLRSYYYATTLLRDKYCFLWWQVLSYYGHPSPWGPAGLQNASFRSGFVNGNRVWCSRMSDRLQAYSHMLTVATLTVDTLLFCGISRACRRRAILP